jgi:hypothetical protein
LTWTDLSHVRQSPEHDELFMPLDEDDPELQDLAESIRELRVLEPIVLSEDRYIVAGHRRFLATRLAGLPQVPYWSSGVHRGRDPEEFVRLMCEHKRPCERPPEELVRAVIVAACDRQSEERRRRRR